MKIIKTIDYDHMSEAAAALICDVISEKPDAVLGLATGSTPMGLYKKLIEWNEEGTVDFEKVRTVNLDEYVGLSKDNSNSYYHVMHEFLFDHININYDNTHLPDGMNPNPEEECERYKNLIESLGGVDVQLLGVGHNGHIGFNEPSDSFDSEVHLEDLSLETLNANKRFFESIDDVPKRAFTMGIQTIMRAKKIILVASGEDKAKIMEEIIEGPVTPKVPASILKTHPDCTIIADSDALKLIKNL